jgi:phosphoenolpyruvate carboxylase
VEAFENYHPHTLHREEALQKMANIIQEQYHSLVQDPAFQHMTSEATPYDFLSLLKIGSRPTKRVGKGKFTLRAIPWILCWTQTRLLLPVWWGIGTAWEQMDHREKRHLKEAFDNYPLFQSYVKNLGFTFSKIELGVWKFHLEHARLTLEERKMWNERIDHELKRSQNFFKELLGHANYTWYNPRLGESIYFRSSMIHPLNVIQKISLERSDRVLLRETVTGIASGMLTTG